MLNVKIVIFDVEGMDGLAQACKLGGFVEQAKLDFVSCDVGDVEGDVIVNSCRVGMGADAGDAALDSEVRDVIVKMGTGCCS